MEPGIYSNIDNETYHNGPGISRSGLKLFRKSPLHYFDAYIQGNKKPQTENLILGNAFHTFLLEPEEFDKLFFVAPKVDKRTKTGKEEWKELEESSNGRILISADDFQQISFWKEAVLKHDDAKKILELKDIVYEQSIYWRDPETQVLCKSKPDMLSLKTGCVFDIKTSSDASFYNFQYDISKYDYHIQAAMTFDGLIENDELFVEDFWFIIVEKEPPYAVATYSLDRRAIERGQQLYKKELHKYKKCLEDNYWPSYATRTVSIPAYAFKDEEDS